MVYVKHFAPPPVCRKELLRYAGASNDNGTVSMLADSVLKELGESLSFKVCYSVLPVEIMQNCCDFGVLNVNSESLAKNISGCSHALLFCGTIGVEIDRFISKYSRISPSRALLFQAAGTERIESLCDAFIKDYEQENGVFLTRRFSPGYADLSLEVQKEIFAILDCPRKIGVSLNESLFMSPTKSVTAIAGITDKKPKEENKCSGCFNTDCAFRSIL